LLLEGRQAARLRREKRHRHRRHRRRCRGVPARAGPAVVIILGIGLSPAGDGRRRNAVDVRGRCESVDRMAGAGEGAAAADGERARRLRRGAEGRSAGGAGREDEALAQGGTLLG
ncbi:unnamed protein product, partial [Ectocarpus sp. 8 AP-2014]